MDYVMAVKGANKTGRRRQGRSILCPRGLTAVSVVVILYPLIFVLSHPISDPDGDISGGTWLTLKRFQPWCYCQQVIPATGTFFTGYKTLSGSIRLWGTLVTIVITFSAAYPPRKKLYGRSKLMGFFLFTMFFGGMIPTYCLMVKNLGLYNTMWAVILVGTVSVYNIIVARTFMPRTRYRKRLYEAASMDGCGDIRVFFFQNGASAFGAHPAVLVLFYGVNFGTAISTA